MQKPNSVILEKLKLISTKYSYKSCEYNTNGMEPVRGLPYSYDVFSRFLFILDTSLCVIFRFGIFDELLL